MVFPSLRSCHESFGDWELGHYPQEPGGQGEQYFSSSRHSLGIFSLHENNHHYSKAVRGLPPCPIIRLFFHPWHVSICHSLHGWRFEDLKIRSMTYYDPLLGDVTLRMSPENLTAWCGKGIASWHLASGIMTTDFFPPRKNFKKCLLYHLTNKSSFSLRACIMRQGCGQWQSIFYFFLFSQSPFWLKKLPQKHYRPDY